MITRTFRGGLYYQYRGYVTQIATPVATIGIQMAMSNNGYMEVHDLCVGRDNYAAGRAIAATRNDAAGNTLPPLGGASIDNQLLNLLGLRTLAENTTALTAEAVGISHIPLVLGGGDQVKVTGASLADTETLTVTVRGFILGEKPTMTVIGAGITLTTSYDRVRGV